MSSRKNVYVSNWTPCDGGESPNAYVPGITAEIRLFYPPLQRALAREALENACADALRKFDESE